MSASLLQFSRDTRFLTIVASPDEHGETTVHTATGTGTATPTGLFKPS